MFTVAAGVLAVKPGSTPCWCLRTAAAVGARTALLAGTGICSGCLVWGLLVSAGLGALFAASGFAYALLRLAGAAYLLWLGAQLLIRNRRVCPPWRGVLSW
jgi:threonine/homoserine/homoserine lactone efflux protein